MTKDWIDQCREKIYNLLDSNFPEGKGRIHDAARHSTVNEKAHFWRPLLSIASGKVYGVGVEKILQYALTPELFHTASLIMDDLPSMDNADFRRGKLSCHKKFDIATTDLCFYYLIEKARTIIQDGNLPDKIKVDLLKASTNTSFELIEGQKRDLYGIIQDEETAFENIISLYEKKTGAMFAYSGLIGGIVGNASKEELRNLYCLGKNLGVAYQIMDDILDVCGNEKTLGKPIHQDKNKITIVDLMGIDNSKELLKNYKDNIQKILLNLKTGNMDSTRGDISYLEELVSAMFPK